MMSKNHPISKAPRGYAPRCFVPFYTGAVMQAEICAKNIKYSVKELTNSLQICAKALENRRIA